MLYYDGMVGMAQKQQNIIKAKEGDFLARQPAINDKSRQMAQGRTISDLFVLKKASEDGYSNRSKSPNSTNLKEDETKKQNNTKTVNSFIERNFHKEVKKQAVKEEKAKKRNEEEDR